MKKLVKKKNFVVSVRPQKSVGRLSRSKCASVS